MTEPAKSYGKALRDGYRAKAFVMTKIDGRTKQEAAKQIEESLKRLQTDHIDLMQHHEVIRMEDPDRIFAEGGAQEALVQAKKAGRSGTSDSPGTRIRSCIFGCSRWPPNINFDSTRCRCRSM